MHRVVTAEILLAGLVGAAALAILVNFVELLCTAGLPAIFTQILALQVSRHLRVLPLYSALQRRLHRLV
jgi:hypothetical protein